MTGSKLIDSSVWLAYLFNNQCANIIDQEELFLLSSLSLFEIKKKLLKSNLDTKKLHKSIGFVKKRSLIIPVTIEIAEHAAENSLQHNLPAVDAIIYTTAQCNEATLVTLDHDFFGLKEVVIPKA